jgi:hypothetical protein
MSPFDGGSFRVPPQACQRMVGQSDDAPVEHLTCTSGNDSSLSWNYLTPLFRNTERELLNLKTLTIGVSSNAMSNKWLLLQTDALLHVLTKTPNLKRLTLGSDLRLSGTGREFDLLAFVLSTHTKLLQEFHWGAELLIYDHLANLDPLLYHLAELPHLRHVCLDIQRLNRSCSLHAGPHFRVGEDALRALCSRVTCLEFQCVPRYHYDVLAVALQVNATGNNSNTTETHKPTLSQLRIVGVEKTRSDLDQRHITLASQRLLASISSHPSLQHIEWRGHACIPTQPEALERFGQACSGHGSFVAKEFDMIATYKATVDSRAYDILIGALLQQPKLTICIEVPQEEKDNGALTCIKLNLSHASFDRRYPETDMELFSSIQDAMKIESVADDNAILGILFHLVRNNVALFLER